MKQKTNIISNLIDWLNKPYFFNNNLSFKFTAVFGLSSCIALFLYFFKPFNIDSKTLDFESFCLGVALSIAFVISFYFLVLHKIFPSFFKEEDWTIGREIITLLSTVFLISLVIWTYNQNFSTDTLIKKMKLLDVVLFVFSLCFIPIIIYLFIDEKYYTHRNIRVSKEIMQKRQELYANPLSIKPKLKRKVQLLSENQKEKVSFKLDNLVYISSQGNYVSFFVREDNMIKEKVLRSRLQTVERELRNFPQIVRCHKSYIINSSLIKNISGNARGYYLHFSEIDNEIPVSRSFDKEKLTSFVG